MKQRSHFLLIILLLASACNYPTTTVEETVAAAPVDAGLALEAEETPEGALVAPPTLPPTRDPNAPILTPTPDAPHSQPTLRAEGVQYVVQAYDTLGLIAQNFGVAWEDIASYNNMANPDALEVGQILNIPPASPQGIGPDFKIIPDSELVHGPAAAYFNIDAFLANYSSYLPQYREEVEGEMLSGPQILMRVATEYSVNPKLLLALLEYQSGWISQANPRSGTLAYPLGFFDSWREGLYSQLSWGADRLNAGYYEWKAGTASGWRTNDASFIPAAATINGGTAAVQNVLALLYPEAQWRDAVSESGFFSIYQSLFGYPFDLAIEPLVPGDLNQPGMQLPFEPGVPWVFSGGPHSGWGSGSSWAALDFAPRGEMIGCGQSGDWVVAATDGLIVRSDNGAVVQDLDGDGYEQSGWTVLYMHIAENQRVRVGDYVQAGDRIGHPSCEGGFATATHLHMARRYNGEWIPAAGQTPFVLDGWVSVSNGSLYDGSMQRDGQTVEACECRDPANMLQR